MRQLIQSWVRAEEEHYGNDLTAAIQKMNAMLGTNFNNSRVAEWRRGVYAPDPETLSTMLLGAMPWILEQAGIEATVAQRRKLEDLIWETGEDADGRWIDTSLRRSETSAQQR